MGGPRKPRKDGGKARCGFALACLGVSESVLEKPLSIKNEQMQPRNVAFFAIAERGALKALRNRGRGGWRFDGGVHPRVVVLDIGFRPSEFVAEPPLFDRCNYISGRVPMKLIRGVGYR